MWALCSTFQRKTLIVLVMSLFLMECHIVASVSGCPVILFTECLVIFKFITVDDLGSGCALPCMPLYATACDIVDNWAPVKLNFWSGAKFKISCSILREPC